MLAKGHMSERYYYIETDGMVYLVEQAGGWILPPQTEEIPFPL